MHLHVRAEVMSDVLQLFAQLIKPVAHGSRPDADTAMPCITRNVMHRSCARPQQELLGERGAKRAVLLHMNSQRLHGDIAKADGCALDCIIAGERFCPSLCPTNPGPS